MWPNHAGFSWLENCYCLIEQREWVQTDTLTDCKGAEPTLLNKAEHFHLEAAHPTIPLATSLGYAVADTKVYVIPIPWSHFLLLRPLTVGRVTRLVSEELQRVFSLRVRHGLFSSLTERNGTSKWRVCRQRHRSPSSVTDSIPDLFSPLPGCWVGIGLPETGGEKLSKSETNWE